MSKELQTVINPEEKKRSCSIIDAACICFEIEKDVLIKGSDREIANLRFQCYYLIKTNTNLKPHQIAHLFNKTRESVNNGIEQMLVQKNIYGHIMRSLRNIVKKANDTTGNEYEFTV